MKIHIPYMSDHAHGFAAALRAYGKDADVMLISTDQALAKGRRVTSSKECMPCLVTMGDILTTIESGSFDKGKDCIFMPTASGPCKFGQYAKLHSLLLKKLGYGEINFLSPTSRDGYGGLGSFKLLHKIWQGIVAIDILLKLLYQTRPYEKYRGDTDTAYKISLRLLIEAIENGNLKSALKKIRKTFEEIETDRSKQKVRIGVVGEVFIRLNKFSNQDVARQVEELGGECQISPFTEWIFWTNFTSLERCLEEKDYKKYISSLLRSKVQYFEEHRLYNYFKGLLRDIHEPSMQEVLEYATPYADFSFGGEAILTIGKSIDYIKKGASGVMNLMPFTCMPGTVISGLAKKIRADYGWVPWLDIAYDAQEGVNIRTRLEAFVYQAQEYSKRKA